MLKKEERSVTSLFFFLKKKMGRSEGSELKKYIDRMN